MLLKRQYLILMQAILTSVLMISVSSDSIFKVMPQETSQIVAFFFIGYVCLYHVALSSLYPLHHLQNGTAKNFDMLPRGASGMSSFGDSMHAICSSGVC